MLAARKADGASAVVQYTPGTAPGKWRPHPNPDACQPADRRSGARCRKLAGDASALGSGDAVYDDRAMAVPAFRTTRPDKRRICPRLRRGETAGREEQRGANGGAIRDRAVLVRGFRTGLEPYCPRDGGAGWAQAMGDRAPAGFRQCGDRRRLYCRVRYTLRLRLLAPGHGNPRCRHGWQRRNHGRPGLGIVPQYAGDPRLPLYAQRGWRRRFYRSRRTSSATTSSPSA